MTEKTQRALTYIVLLSTVEAILFLIGDKLPVVPEWAFIPALGLASFRGGRALSFNGVFVWLRDLCQIKATPDSSGAGDSNNPYGRGPLYVLGELLCCPICSGTWVAVMLLAVRAAHPPTGNAMILALSAAGIAELAHWVSESHEWAGRYYREESGSQWLAKNTPQVVFGRNGHTVKIHESEG